MFIHLLVLLFVSVSVIATPAPEPDVVAQDVGGCTSGFPVCCAVATGDYSEGAECTMVPNVSACSNSTTTLCCEGVDTVEITGIAGNCTASS
ncbi:hypothetical protein CY34DRAFT_811482 [Suillus luteus UH-Slu-Lm8-n1]|uniref:Hydrophobin n=1 Tax=Suillus luteus UH-Slu-Lm8-n1 TaxID=930992 RepID=A0A0D0A3B4_9AGAM|nr:hypothetical protein CY34DRAFT_811482 [Suillus luteus UH-Slu-Lm8-n1]